MKFPISVALTRSGPPIELIKGLGQGHANLLCSIADFVRDFTPILEGWSAPINTNKNLETSSLVGITPDFFVQLRIIHLQVPWKSEDIWRSLDDFPREKVGWGGQTIVSPPLTHDLAWDLEGRAQTVLQVLRRNVEISFVHRKNVLKVLSNGT